MESKPQRGWRWWLKVVLGGAGALLLLAVAVVLITGARAKAEIRAENSPPGRLFPVDGYEMHLHCEGEGRPTVILEAGSGIFSLHWVSVQEQVAEFTRVCAYDRAGLGWSEASPRPRTAEVIVDEMDSLLTEAGIAEPYVLVGHSLGGIFARLYADEYPDKVAGMVLVDSAHADQYIRAPEAYREWTEEYLEQTQQQLALGRFLSASGLMALNPEFVAGDPNLPPATNETYRAIVAANPSYFSAVGAVTENIDAILEEAGAAQIELGDTPLVVIARGQAQEAAPAIGLTETLVAQYEPVWRELQRELPELSTQGELVIAEESGHYIQLEQPEVVVNTIRRLMTSVREP